MPDRFALSSYQTAEDRIRSNGHIFDVGQISPEVLSQLYMGVSLGIIRVSRDSWPIRGLTIDDKTPVRTVFELARKESVTEPVHETIDIASAAQMALYQMEQCEKAFRDDRDFTEALSALRAALALPTIRPRVIVEMSGGCVQQVYVSDESIKVSLVDHDEGVSAHLSGEMDTLIPIPTFD